MFLFKRHYGKMRQADWKNGKMLGGVKDLKFKMKTITWYLVHSRCFLKLLLPIIYWTVLLCKVYRNKISSHSCL